MGSYRELRTHIKGVPGLEVHHLIEKRFADALGVTDRGGMLGIVLVKGDHQAITNAWRQAIGYGRGTMRATRAGIVEALRKVHGYDDKFSRVLEKLLADMNWGFMRVLHKLWAPFPPSAAEEARTLGVKLSGNIVDVDLDDTDPRLPAVQEFCRRYGGFDTIETVFEPADILAAPWLRLGEAWQNGYPQPEAHFAYEDEVYGGQDYCRRCGVGRRQVHPFRIRKEPNWGRRSVFGLFWVPYVLFLKADVWAERFAPLGFECWPVLHRRGDRAWETVVQWKIDTVAASPVDHRDLERSDCTACGAERFMPHERGAFPPFTGDPEPAGVMRTQEWFGDHPSSFREILVSQALARTLRLTELRGLDVSI